MEHLLKGKGTLAERVKALREKEAARRGSAQVDEGAQSQMEYRRGVSNWNFDVEELRAQAALLGELPENAPGQTKEKEEPTIQGRFQIHESMPEEEQGGDERQGRFVVKDAA